MVLGQAQGTSLQQQQKALQAYGGYASSGDYMVGTTNTGYTTIGTITTDDWLERGMNRHVPKGPETALEWLDRRVNEMRVAL